VQEWHGAGDNGSAADRKAATQALEFFGLKGFGARARDELSYGQMRRVPDRTPAASGTVAQGQ
jgi:ABC-type nitrate/sulfonate/bicarbonate transport system ATPase subunit